MTAAFPREDDLILRLITYELERLQNNTRDVINNDFLAVTACCGLLADPSGESGSDSLDHHDPGGGNNSSNGQSLRREQ
jgi:hypothetical protein